MNTRTRIIEPDVLNVLAASECHGTHLHLPPGQLDRKLYQAVNDVLEAVGGKWNRKAKAHVFEAGTDAADAVDAVVATGTYTKAKDDFGFFETPDALAGIAATQCMIEPGMLVLEPSAGTGRLADAAKAFGGEVMCYELLPKNVEALRAKDYATAQVDFLTVDPKHGPPADRVLMNPPFDKRADIHHIRHAFSFLKPGGRLVAIASKSVEFRTDKLATEFRQFVAEHGGSIEPLPEGSFKESGTMVNTVLVTIPNLP